MGPQLDQENHRSQSLWPSVLSGARNPSRGAWRALGRGMASLGVLGLCLGTASCIIIQDEDTDEGTPWVEEVPPPSQPSEVPITVDIDTGATLTVEPGEGVGVFVEHRGAGEWRISTSCDTNFSGYACGFQLNLVALDLTVLETEELESDDVVTQGSDLVYFDPTTAFDHDGIVLEAEPGAGLRLEVFLDGQSEPRFTYWIGGGILHTGAPSNPVDFRPVEPDLGEEE